MLSNQRNTSRNTRRLKRHQRVRKQISGTAERPRLAVFKSRKYVYAQIINDLTGQTLVSASSLEKALPLPNEKVHRQEVAATVGERLAERALEKGLEKVVFDRGGHIYHGVVAALAEGARQGGLQF